MLEFLLNMPFWGWFVLAGIFLLGELVTGTTFLLWPAVAAVILGLITTVQLDGQWVTQWVIFAALTVVLGFVGRPYADRWINNAATDKPMLNQFALRKSGKRGVVTADFVAGQGRVRLGDSEWSAAAEEGAEDLKDGDNVVVVRMEGTIAVVAKLATA